MSQSIEEHIENETDYMEDFPFKWQRNEKWLALDVAEQSPYIKKKAF